jgi:alkanesulfonate monooxygenase SsuD/methylene tetrahydromethanopterin reductase-like flavin-dependent oxidoreductase (luciferase family)
MDVGVSLPTQIPDLKPGRAIEWAKKAEELGFSSLAVADRLQSNRYECLTALAMAAGVTERVRLITTIMISPLHTSAVYLAKQAATIDHVSNGRLSLGLAVGNREDDYELSGANFHRRGRDLDRQIATMRSVWAGEKGVGPAPVQEGGPAILVGGSAPSVFERAARNDGWIAGAGGGAEGFRRGKEQVLELWAKEGRSGMPRFVAVGHFALGPTAREDALRVLTYSYGPERAESMLGGVPMTTKAVAELLASFAAEGCDEVILAANSQDLAQLDFFAEAVQQSKVA